MDTSDRSVHFKCMLQIALKWIFSRGNPQSGFDLPRLDSNIFSHLEALPLVLFWR